MTTIAEMDAWPDGCPVNDFECKVVKAFQRQDGEGKKGPWWRDDLVVEDSEGTEIKLKHWQSPHPAPFRPGSVLVVKGKILSYEGTRFLEGRGPNVAPAGTVPAPAPVAKPAGGQQPRTAFRKDPKLTVDECLALAVRARWELTENGWTDEQAIMAHVNTIIIGLKSGDIEVFNSQTEPIPYEAARDREPGENDGEPPYTDSELGF